VISKAPTRLFILHLVSEQHQIPPRYDHAQYNARFLSSCTDSFFNSSTGVRIMADIIQALFGGKKSATAVPSQDAGGMPDL
jgi:hypothetical protein